MPGLLASLRVLLAADDTHVASVAVQVQSAVEAAHGRARLPPLQSDRAAWLRGMVEKTLSLADPLFRHARARRPAQRPGAVR